MIKSVDMASDWARYAKLNDISPNWRGASTREQRAIDSILAYESTPFAVVRFDQLKRELENYWYWFTLGTLWVSYSGWSDLDLWRKLFFAGRKHRSSSLMKPSEYEAFQKLPNRFTAFRAHREGETSWISYTLDRDIAERLHRHRGGEIRTYELQRDYCTALFLRRGEQEILMLDPQRARLI